MLVNKKKIVNFQKAEGSKAQIRKNIKGLNWPILALLIQGEV